MNYPPPSAEVLQQIARDPHLSERQRRLLLDLDEQFRDEAGEPARETKENDEV